ncbi:hypothetical protein ACFYSC_21285 [Streptosporangium sp. NPDC004379]|uniref:hypothetical protein n=1 Tax=Streptosporangium sp. NPDC004379 TaxID=3366189 RepID=UPI0036AF8A4D
MALQTITLSVLIASPRDTAMERDTVEDVIRSWNSDHTLERKIHLLPLRWELGAVPLVGSQDAQEVINDQLTDAADIVIALFNSRLGKATKRAVSGTAEEIIRARDRGAAVHVFFSEAPVPRDHDPEQLASLNEFRRELEGYGLTGSYVSQDDLSAKVRRCLERDAYKIGDGGQGEDAAAFVHSGVVLRSRYLYDLEPRYDNRGRPKAKRINERIRVENLGEVAAEDVVIEISPVGEGETPILLNDLTAARILPHSYVDFTIVTHQGTAVQGNMTHRWVESGELRSEEQTISFT